MGVAANSTPPTTGTTINIRMKPRMPLKLP